MLVNHHPYSRVYDVPIQRWRGSLPKLRQAFLSDNPKGRTDHPPVRHGRRRRFVSSQSRFPLDLQAGFGEIERERHFLRTGGFYWFVSHSVSLAVVLSGDCRCQLAGDWPAAGIMGEKLLFVSEFPAVSAGLLLVLLTGVLVRYLLPRSSDSPPPPCIRGWIPWFGAAFEMGKAPLEFIERARKKYGPVFTVMAAGNRLTFVSGAEGLDAFFTSKKVSFPQAVQEPVQRTASIGKENFYKNHTAIHEAIKLHLSRKRLQPHVARLCGEFWGHLERLAPRGTEELYGLVRRVMYPAVVDTLFGKGVCPTSEDTLEEFEEHFRRFDEGFEYGSQLPECFLRSWSQSKQWLLKLFKNIVTEMESKEPEEGDSKTLLEHLLDTIKGVATYNNSLLLLWASQANANPITFWTLAFIISDPLVYKNAMDEISSVFGEAGKKFHLTEADLTRLPYIKNCMLEAIRLRSPGAVTRKVLEPLKIYNYRVPAGDMLMLSPFWLHRDPQRFPDPDAFRPERWKKANLEKNVFLDGFVAFGGGKYQCPGRWFALMEIHMLVALMLYRYEFHLLDPVPKQSNLHLVGTQQPDGPCRVRFKQRG